MLDSFDSNLTYNLKELINICDRYEDSCKDKSYYRALNYTMFLEEIKLLIKLFGKKRYDRYCSFVHFKVLFAVTFRKMAKDIELLKDEYFYYYHYEYGQSIINEVISLYLEIDSPKDFKNKTYEEYEDKVSELIAKLRTDVNECIKQERERKASEEAKFKREKQRREEEARKARGRYSNYYREYFNSYDPFNNYSYYSRPQEEKPNNSTIPYEVKKAFIELGLQSGSDVSVSIIKKAYKKMALKHHPDRGGSVEKMAEINSYYETAIKWLTRNK